MNDCFSFKRRRPSVNDGTFWTRVRTHVRMPAASFIAAVVRKCAPLYHRLSADCIGLNTFHSSIPRLCTSALSMPIPPHLSSWCKFRETLAHARALE